MVPPHKDVLPSLLECLTSAFPPATVQLIQEASSDEPDFAAISRTISLDSALTAAVLSLANSSAYGLTQKITDVKRAALALGSREVLNMAMSISLLGAIRENSDETETRFTAWRQMVWAAVTAKEIARTLAPGQEDMAFLYAMLKDLALEAIRLHGEDEDLPESEHARVSLLLLQEWGVAVPHPAAIVRHHDLQGLQNYEPCVQAVILATRWAESSLSDDEDPATALQLELQLASCLGTDPAGIDTLRERCVTLFQDMLATLNINEAAPEERYYHYSLSEMQLTYVLGMEVMHVTGGLKAVARTVARQLKWNFAVADFELALLNENGQDYTLFVSDGDLEVATAGGMAAMDALPWTLTDRGLPMYASGRYVGELRVPLTAMGDERLSRLLLYARFLGQGVHHYLQGQAVVEAKARTLDTLPIGVARTDARGRVLELNRPLAKMLEVDGNQRGQNVLKLLGQALGTEFDPEWTTFFQDDSRPSISKLFCDFGSGGKGTPCMHLSANRCPPDSTICDTGADVLILLQDITEMSELDMQAMQRLDFLHQLLGSMREVVMTVNADGDIKFISPGMSGDMVGRNLFRSAKPVESTVVDWSPQILSERTLPLEVIMRMGSGELKPMELAFSRLRGSAETTYLVVGRDLTAVRRLEQRLKRQAVSDGLTGLFNHEHFQALLTRECRRSTRTKRALTLLFIDLDGFKTINDRLGHQAGDKLLRRFGRLLAKQTRYGMDYPCRYGGDEFTVLMAESDTEQALVVAKRIVEAVVKAFRERIAVSIGVACFRIGEEEPTVFLRRADKASYGAKSAGGGRIVVAPGDLSGPDTDET